MHHATRLETYEQIAAKVFPKPATLRGKALGQYISLRAGLRYERAWLDWADEACVLLQREAR
jgi:hypothetical protein